MITPNDSASAPPRENTVRTITDLRGPAGQLEALLNPSRRLDPPKASVLLCHPHPLYGGTVHNKVVYHAMKCFIDLGLPVLRFNFRGTGRSEGAHDYGRGEQDDVRAGLDWLHREFELPIIAAGFSFGAHMALRAGVDDPRVPALVSLGTPIQAADRAYTYEFLHHTNKPILFLSGTADEFGPMQQIQDALDVAGLPNKQLSWITGADHFFVGKLDLMQVALRAWIQAHNFSTVTPQSTETESQS